MALEDGRDYANIPEDMDTDVQELINVYGAEAVRRGLEYMNSLSKAEENYKESAEGNKMQEGYEEGLGDDYEDDSGGVDEAVSKWREGMEENGLGINNE